MRRECKAPRSSKGLLGLGRATLNLALAGCFVASSLLPSVVITVLVTLPQPAYAQEGSSESESTTTTTTTTTTDAAQDSVFTGVTLPRVEVTGYALRPGYTTVTVPSDGSHGNGGMQSPPTVTVRAPSPAPAPARPEPGPKDPAPKNTAQPPANADSGLGSCMSGHPVVIASGEKHQTETDFVGGGEYSLGLSRTYKSFSGAGRMFGPRWVGSYDIPTAARAGCVKNQDYLNVCIKTSVTFKLPDGSSATYLKDADVNSYTYRLSGGGGGAAGSFSHVPGESWAFGKDKLFYVYSDAGNIQTITTSGSAVLRTFVYGAVPTQPIQVTNTAGQSVFFTWTGARVTSIKDPNGNFWTYGYNAAGMLSTVTSPGASPDIRTYLYEDARDVTRLTGISINGARYSTYSYYADNRVQSSGLAGGEEGETFVYGNNQTTMTTVVGQPVTYSFAPVQGALNPVQVSRAPTASCAAASAQTFYDANGWVDYKLDWNGNKTDYTFDINGKLLDVTTAAGTPSASTTVNTWSGDNLMEVNYRDASGVAYMKLTYAYVTLVTSPAYGKIGTETMTDLRTGEVRTTTYGYTYYPSKVMATMTVTKTMPVGTATTTINYDTLGNVATITNPLNQQVTLSNYNGLGFPGRVTDANGVSTDYTYDARGNLTTTVQNLGTGNRTTTFAYNNAHQVTDITYPSGRVDRFRYTASLRLEYTGNALNEFVHLAYDTPTNTATKSVNRNVPLLRGTIPFANAAGQFSATKRMDSLGRPWVDLGNGGQQGQLHL